MSDIRNFFQGGGDKETPSKDSYYKRKLSQKKYDQTKRKRLVREDWLKEFPWAKVENGEVLHCEICRKFPEISDKDSTLVKGIKEKYRKETLKFHDRSVKHLKCIERQAVIEKPQSSQMAASIKKVDEKNSVVYEKLFNTAYYIAKNNESFRKYPELMALQRKNGVEVGKNYINEPSCREFCINIGEVLKDKTANSVQNARFISVLSDGSTDNAIVEQELVYVRYVGEDGVLKTELADTVNLEHGHAQGVKDGILKGLNTISLTVEDVSKKLVGINTDGASVNLGKKGGAVKLLMNRVNEELSEESTCDDYMTVVHCVAHNLELAVCDAKKDVRYLAEFERVLKGIFQLYYYSPKRRRELFQIATSLDQELKHYGGLQQIRWVASQSRALKALLDNYDVTMMHLQEISMGKDENSNKSRGYLKEMKTERFVSYLHFMIDWTNVISEVSVLFQQKKCLISEVARRVNELKEKCVAMKTRRGKLMRKFLRDSEDGKFRGDEMTQRQGRRNNDTTEQIASDIDDMLSATESFLDQRFVKHLEGEPHALFSVFDFHQWPNKDNNIDDFRVYGDEQIDKLLTLYGPLLTDEEKESAVDEWLDLKMYVSRNMNRSLVDAYESILGNHDDVQHLTHIVPLVNIMLTISPSTAECERGFSQLNQVKTQLRTSMNQDTLCALQRITVDGPTLSDFIPTESIVKWLNSGKGSRHTAGHTCCGPRPKRPRLAENSDTE